MKLYLTLIFLIFSPQLNFEIDFNKDVREFVLGYIQCNYSVEEIREFKKSQFIPLNFSINTLTKEILNVSISRAGLIYQEAAHIPRLDESLVDMIINTIVNSDIKVVKVKGSPLKQEEEIYEFVVIVDIENL
jgi:hypothetical protein